MQKICKTTAIISTFPLIKQTQRQVYFGFILNLFVSLFILLVTKLKHQITGIWIVLSVEPIKAPTLRPHYQRLCRLRITKQILLHISMYLLQIGLKKKRAVHVIDVLGQLLHTYTLLAHIGQNPQYLLVVRHSRKRSANV